MSDFTVNANNAAKDVAIGINLTPTFREGKK